MSQVSLEKFFQDVWTNPDLQEALGRADNLSSFGQLAVQVGQEKGYDFTIEEVEAELLSAQIQSGAKLTDEDLSAIAKEIEPWRYIIGQLRWVRGKNPQVWDRLKNLKK